MKRLGETTNTVYAELLDQLRRTPLVPHSGSFVSKTIGGASYWYVQRKDGGKIRQVYLGPESPELLERMARSDEARESRVLDEARRRDLVAMLASGGMAAEPAPVAGVLTTLADAGLFRAGAVLVGTQAFRCIANMLGVRFESENLRTADTDVGQGTIRVAVGEKRIDVLEELRASDPRFAAVPELDPRHPSTSFKVRGRDLRVDLLVPGTRERAAPIHLPHLNAAAQPMVGLGYLLDEVAEAAVVAGAGILVTVPSPGRFAFHKLWVSDRRPVAESAKARKDRRQAEQLIEVLLSDRPGDLTRAWAALPKRIQPAVRRGVQRMSSAVREGVRAVFSDAALSRR